MGIKDIFNKNRIKIYVSYICILSNFNGILAWKRVKW